MSYEWIVIRGSGLVAYTLLSLATIWGLLISTKLATRLAKPKGVTNLHESLGLGALLATGAHMAALAMDDFIEFGWAEILIPGRATWRPAAVALGVLAFYALGVVSLSFYVKRWIGQKTWRSIHFLSLGSFTAALVHGLAAGSDSGLLPVLALYVLSGTVVIGLLAIRLLQASGQQEGIELSKRNSDHGSPIGPVPDR